MKITLVLGLVWAGICLIVLWVAHRFVWHNVSKVNRQKPVSQIPVEMEDGKNVTRLTSKDDEKIVSTNLRIFPKTGKITSPSGEIELESYRRAKTAETAPKTPSDRDVGEE
jgi:hypothetical protein